MNLTHRRRAMPRPAMVPPGPALARLALAACLALAGGAAGAQQAPADAAGAPVALPGDAPAAPPAGAPDGGAGLGTLRFNGFGTLGLVSVSPRDDWGFRRESIQPAQHDGHLRADVDTRLGLQATWHPRPEFDVVGQVVLRPMASSASWSEDIEWAFAAWHPTPAWTVRAGRTSPDLFLLADARNVGFAYPWIRPNVEFYSWMPLHDVDGIDVSRQGTLGSGRWTGKLFLGRSAITIASSHDDGDTRARVSPVSGGTLTWESDGLTVKATLARAVSRAYDTAALGALHDVLDQVAALPVQPVAGQALQLRDSFPGTRAFVTHYSALGAAYDDGRWLLQAEGARTTGNFYVSSAWYAYGSAGMHLGPFTVFGMAGHARAARSPLPQPQWQAALTPLIGPVAAAAAQSAATQVADSSILSRADEDSLSAGVRWDLGAQAALKFQVDRVRSAAQGGGLWSYDTVAPHRATVVSAGLDFVL